MTLCRYLRPLLLGCLALLVAPWAMAVTCSGIFPQEMKEQGVSLDLGFLSNKALDAFPSTTQTLQSGDLFFEGGSLNNGQTLSVQTGVTTRIFVQGDLTLEPHSSLNPDGRPENLILIVNGTLTIKPDQQSQKTINALIYAVRYVDIGNGREIKGAVTSYGLIGIHKNHSSVEYDSDAVAKADFGNLLCDGGSEPRIDHYRLSYSNPALTCQPHQVTIKACANADCSLTYTDGPSRISFSPGGWNSTVFNFFGSTTGVLAVRKKGVVTLGIDGVPQPAAQHQLKCIINGVISAECPLNFAESGFLVEVPDFVSGQAATATIQAVAADPDDPAVCTPAFDSGTREVGLSFSYIDPIATEEQGQQVLTVADKTLRQNDPSLLDLTFAVIDNRKAVAQLKQLGYLDVGRLQLNVSYSGTGPEEGLELSGKMDFVVRPASLSVLATGAPACEPQQPFTTDNCAKYKAAGESFDLKVKALNALGGEVKNFRHPAVDLEVVAEAGNDRFYPRAGVVPLITPGTYKHGLSNTNEFDHDPEIDEVGIVKIRASAADYLESGHDVSGISAFVGRFTPAYLQVGGSGALKSCDGISYQGEAVAYLLPPTLNVRGMSSSGLPLENYDYENFWRLDRPGLKWQPQNEARDISARLIFDNPTETVMGGNDGGERSLVWAADGLTYTLSEDIAWTPGTEDLPFSLRLNFPAQALTDSDGICRKSSNDDDCLSFDLDLAESGIRLGRLKIGNAHGPEQQALELPWVIESWQGTAAAASFQKELFDRCSARIDFPNDLGVPELSQSLGALQEVVNKPIDLQSGNLHLDTPEVPGSVSVSFPQLKDWLHYDWDGDGVREPPSGLATFGIYKGPKPLIFRREVYR